MVIFLQYHVIKNLIMKNIYIKTILFVICTFSSCKAQQIYPLNTDYLTVANNSYLKDINNELDQFIGEYKATYQNLQYDIYIAKEIQKPITILNKSFYQDVLIVKFIIKNSNGLFVQDTYNFQQLEGRNQIQSAIVDQNKTILYYTGTNCRVGWGEIILQKLNGTQLSWEYRPNSTLLGDDCPSNADKTVYLPVTKDLIFTKQ